MLFVNKFHCFVCIPLFTFVKVKKALKAVSWNIFFTLNDKNMSIKYQVLPRKNPQDVTAPDKFYTTAIGDSNVDLENLAKKISYQCTVSEADCYAVLISLERNIPTELEEGKIVKSGRLGNFQVGLNSYGKVTAAEITTSAITKSQVLFRPDKRLKNLLNTVTYSKIS
jgi:predicted histone-like DNA-binding protein